MKMRQSQVLHLAAEIYQTLLHASRAPRSDSRICGDFVIRGSRRDDLPGICEVIAKSSSQQLTRMRRILVTLFGSKMVIVASELKSKQVIGPVVGADLYRLKFLPGFGWAMHEELIVVDPRFRRFGISTEMRLQAMDHFRRWDLGAITTTIYSTNTASLKGALRVGWSIYASEEVLSSTGVPRTRYTLIKRLNAPDNKESG